jgi:hypothetical protein
MSINTRRKRQGLEPFPILAGAYDPREVECEPRVGVMRYLANIVSGARVVWRRRSQSDPSSRNRSLCCLAL